jgi:DNA repair exonuclease SbcCD ATPase subunit
VSLVEAVRNGPRATNAKAAHLEAQIRMHEARAKQAQDAAATHRRRATGDGPLAKSRRIRADAQATVADRHRAAANRLRTELAKLKADRAAQDAKHARHVVASTTDEHGTGPTIPDQRPGQVANPGQPPPIPSDHPAIPAQPKGSTMTAISGEAVNIEQTRASLDQLKTQVTDLRGSFEGMSGSLASGGLNKLAGSLATADDALDSVTTQIAAAEKQLADQEAIAEAAQAAGEMHAEKSFYGA